MSPKVKPTPAQWQEMDRIARHERAGWIGCFLICSTSTSLALTRRGWIEPNVDGSYRLSATAPYPKDKA